MVAAQYAISIRLQHVGLPVRITQTIPSSTAPPETVPNSSRALAQTWDSVLVGLGVLHLRDARRAVRVLVAGTTTEVDRVSIAALTRPSGIVSTTALTWSGSVTVLRRRRALLRR